MPLAGIALAPLLVSPLAPPSPRRSSVAAGAADAARRPRAVRRERCCWATAAAGGGRDAGELSRATLLWRAVKLPIYSVALVPLTIGNACAYNHAGLFFATRYFGLLAAAVLVITWLNLSNDVYDSDTGADKNKKESVVNIIGSRTVTQYAANISLLLGFVGLFWAFAEAGDVRFIFLVISAIVCGYVYQCPPFRLSYQGLGEPLCFAAFGPLATTAFYFSNSTRSISRIFREIFYEVFGKTGALKLGYHPYRLTKGTAVNYGNVLLPLSKTVIASSILVGLTTTLILFCSHFHQIDGDRAVGKMSPLVRIGTEAGARLVMLGIITLYALLFAFSISKYLPPSCSILGALTLPVGKWVVDYVLKNHDDNTKIFMAKYYCVRLHVLFGMALASGLVMARNSILA